MTDDATRDPIADWHAQFAPPSVGKGPQPVDVAARHGTVEHFADADGVFAPPVPVEAEPEHGEGEAHEADAEHSA